MNSTPRISGSRIRRLRRRRTSTITPWLSARASCAAGIRRADARATRAKHIVRQGGSAGGMLMGAVAGRAGELFAGIVAEVPFVDVLSTMRDVTVPLTPRECHDWGNPIESAAAFKT